MVELEIQSDSEIESVADHHHHGGAHGDGDGELYDSSSDDDDDNSSAEENQFAQEQQAVASSKKNNAAKDIARNDSNSVCAWKILVLFLMASMTTMVSAGAYYFLKDEENDDYTKSYNLLTNSIRDAIDNHVEQFDHGLATLSQVISSDARARNTPLPYYTLPTFEVLVASTTSSSSQQHKLAELVLYSPILEQIDDIPAWITYATANQGWLVQSFETVNANNDHGEEEESSAFNNTTYTVVPIAPYLYNLGENQEMQTVDPTNTTLEGPFAPLWQLSPPPTSSEAIINLNLLSIDFENVGFRLLNQTREAQFSKILEPGQSLSEMTPGLGMEDHEAYHNSLVEGVEMYQKGNADGTVIDNRTHSVYLVPVFEDAYDETSPIKAFLTAYFTWDRFVVDLLPEGVEGIVCVVQNDCGQAVSYELVGRHARYLGPGDHHDERFASTKVVVPFYRGNRAVDEWGSKECHYEFVLYASEKFEQSYRSDQPIAITAIVGSAFVVLIGAFFIYDLFVQRRNRKVVAMATKTNEIVASLFPEAVRERLFQDNPKETKKASAVNGENDDTIKKFLSGNTEMDDEVDEAEEFMYKTRPIADLYPETTIMFADIAGFTAWSSTRDPAQVFTLLETFYKAFDDIASRKGIFKVETIGDCYVAVAGLPEPREDHAVVMCRFASECMARMNFLSRKLEVHLGPDTAELEMRAGLHSGAVTAGVLRGVRSRFQLFGDTMNTASRMESTGQRGKVQISQETADLLVSAGKMSWISPREERVIAKGKGEMQTYWVNVGTTIDISGFQDGYGSIDGSLSDEDGPFAALSPKTTRLVLWNVEILLDLLRQIHVQRGEDVRPFKETVVLSKESTRTAYEEVEDVIQFPHYKGQVYEIETDSVELSPEVENQLEDFLSTIAGMYIENHFHDFAHASHATMGVVKLLSSLVKAKSGEDSTPTQNASYLIASNPLVQFAIVLSVISHDVDHPGVPNSVLVSEKSRMASVYGFKSVAEQNSLDLVWDLLMDDSYAELRAAIYRTEEEKKLFRQILVNCILATDLFDKPARDRFDSRWKVGFPDDTSRNQASGPNLQATLIMESMIQAADIAHTMQHWQVYRKWNVRLFEELYQSFADGRNPNDPSESWYEGEMKFYDDYVLPLVRRLQRSGAFVAASTDSHLDYAEQNRTQWQEKGKDIVAEMVDATRGKIMPCGPEGPVDTSERMRF